MKSLFLAVLLLTSTVWAHDVFNGAGVSVQLHTEPNDEVFSGKPTLAWFAMITKSEKPERLTATECRCTVLVYAGTPSPRVKPLLAVPLENLGDKPSTGLLVPKAGEYTVVLDARPQSGYLLLFAPFKAQFKFTAK